MTGCGIRSNDWACLLLKTMLGKLRYKYQLYPATYRTHAMTTHHGGTGHTGEDRNLNSYIEDTGDIDIGPNNDNESTKSLDTMLAFGG